MVFVFSARRIDWLLRGLIVGAVLAAFWPVLRAGFVNWDDPLNIYQNPHLGLEWENLRWMFTDTDYVRRYLPLGWLSYTVDRVLFGGGPLSYHAGNLLLHAVNTLLLYAIIKKILQRNAMRASAAEAGAGDFIADRRSTPSMSSVAAGVGALWWALNP